ncbi:hypothetical protein HDV57DRAFT_195854 [Trichoderma longibrachiatum]|uniref:Uncharacterized protein n=1 Tax=Trichoderma longibrachiatum ATCC 18648 TaxID=983965 RepID=A0A2T4C8K2_TRILO|nr:hypothetical protein M440DRAFT_295708 [Trichoderma longibrachiatum ATCC 18648]
MVQAPRQAAWIVRWRRRRRQWMGSLVQSDAASKSSRWRRGGAPCKAEVGCRSHDLSFWSRSIFPCSLFQLRPGCGFYFLPCCVSTSYKTKKESGRKKTTQDAPGESAAAVAQPQSCRTMCCKSDGLVRGSRRTASNSAWEEEEDDDDERVADGGRCRDKDSQQRHGRVNGLETAECSRWSGLLRGRRRFSVHPPPSGLAGR